MRRGNFIVLSVLFFNISVFAQAREPVAQVYVEQEGSQVNSSEVMNETPTQYDYVSEVMDVLPWKEKINDLFLDILTKHYRPRSVEELKKLLIDGTYNSFDLYDLAPKDRRHLKTRFKLFFQQSTSNNTLNFAEVDYTKQAEDFILLYEEDGGIFVNESYFSWVEETVFRQKSTQEIFASVRESQKYATLFQGIAKMLDPNSWFAYNKQSHIRAANFIHGPRTHNVHSVAYSSQQNIFEKQHLFGTVELNNRVLFVRFARDIYPGSAQSLFEVLIDQQENYDSIAYDFRKTLGGAKAEFAKTLEPFIALPEKDILLASFFDRNGYEAIQKRLLIHRQESALRTWQYDIIHKPLIVNISPMSASGAEIVAMGVQDLGLGVLVGQKSSGKMTAAHPNMVGPFAFYLTQYKFFSPKGRSPRGVEPDLELYLVNENDYVRNYKKKFAIISPKKLSKDQLQGVYADSTIMNIDYDEKKTSLQRILKQSFLKHKDFKSLLDSKTAKQDKIIQFIAHTLSDYCQRESLTYSCDLEQMNESIQIYTQ